jgi:hypothetical protein
MYDAAGRRFMVVDWAGSNIAFTQTFNQYAYVINNPLKYIDPMGLKLKEFQGFASSTAHIRASTTLSGSR